MVFGNVLVKPMSALLIQHKEFFDKIDPYVKIYMGNDKYTTDVSKNSGSNPIWNNEFIFKNCTMENTVLRFEVWDKNKLIDTSLGSVDYALVNLLQAKNHFNGGLQLLHKGLNSGTLFLDIQFIEQGLITTEMQGMTTGLTTGTTTTQNLGMPTVMTGGMMSQGTQCPTTCISDKNLIGQQQVFEPV